MTAAISEAASKSRGRPKSYDNQILSTLSNAMGSRAKTNRQKQTIYLAIKAANRLADNGKFIAGVEQLVDDPTMTSRKAEHLIRMVERCAMEGGNDD